MVSSEKEAIDRSYLLGLAETEDRRDAHLKPQPHQHPVCRPGPRVTAQPRWYRAEHRAAAGADHPVRGTRLVDVRATVNAAVPPPQTGRETAAPTQHRQRRPVPNHRLRLLDRAEAVSQMCRRVAGGLPGGSGLGDVPVVQGAAITI